MNYYNLKYIIFSSLFIVINLLYLLKYGTKYNLPLLPIIIGLTVLQVCFLGGKTIIYKLLSKLNSIIYILLVCIILGGILFLTKYVDRYALNVDRWSAMEVAIRAIFTGEYPYTAIDHLGGRTSNFPGLLLLGIPFYLLGDVGYFQAFSFLFLAFTLYKVFKRQRAFFILLLLGLSIPFWYEIAVISDFMSNMIIVLCFIMLWNHYFKQEIYKKEIGLAIGISILVLTRGFTYIPLALYFFAPFCQLNIKKQLRFSVSFLVTSILLILFVFYAVPDLETLKEYNPLVLQTSYTSIYHILFVFLAPLILSFYIKKFNDDFFFYTLLITGTLSITLFIQFWNRVGFNELLHNSVFDLAYLAYIFPILWILLSNPTPK
ncbi:hypothetical protein [Myroides sp. WP-1]|uniref:hypothetical protein n=1 Tax=Myroides sp. WP-1 TaxID=2759944 RepID=UPI0015FC8BC8|nr:hypothetical protein [Myroides sp. WP-1]MBB1138751.1 hypothetical protein [Myroides sp. WP-1]